MTWPALKELVIAAELTLKALDDYNEKNGTSIVGPSLFRLGRALSEGRAALEAIEAIARPVDPVPQADLERLAELLEFTGRHLPGLPWSVHGDAGKPMIAGAKSGNLFYGHIATWKEADLLCLAINSLPAMLSEIQRARNPLDAPVNDA